MIEKKTDPFTGEEKYEMDEDAVKELSLGAVILGGTATVIGAMFGYKCCERIFRKRIGKYIPGLIDRTGEIAANAALDAAHEMGNHDVRRFIERNGNDICGRACEKFYSRKEVQDTLKFCKKLK